MTENFKNTALGIELGSTRIKAVLIGPDHRPLASGEHAWASRYEDGRWTYSLDQVWDGLRDAYARLAADAREKLGAAPRTFGAVGISGMMHGYLPFDREGRQLAPFRTWQNTCTAPAAEELSRLFGFNIPQRWSVAHLYQAVLDGEPHVAALAQLTTLAGYVHRCLTGEACAGVGEASGMFPVRGTDYDADLLDRFDARLAGRGYPWRLRDLLPRVLPAGAPAGALTAEGARLLDPSGTLLPGVPFCPPEGDAGTGMVCTDAVAPRTGNVSAGTSIFAMVVLERPLSRVYPQIDVVATPDGAPVAMVHCNNGTEDMNAWAAVLRETAELFGAAPDTGELFTRLYRKSLEGDADCGGMLVYNLLSGEPVAGLERGAPMVVRGPDSRFTLANLMRAQLYSALAGLRMGMDILKRERVCVDSLTGHGGMFKTPGVAQRYLAAAMESPVSVMETAGEGGPYGMALLAMYMLRRAGDESLRDYLERRVFSGAVRTVLRPEAADTAGFLAFLSRYKNALPAESAAAEVL